MENKNNNAPVIPPCAPCKPQNGILVFGIGVLVGAIIATAVFMIGAHAKSCDKQMMGGRQMQQMQQMQGQGQMQGPQGMPGQPGQQPNMQGQNSQPQQNTNENQ